MEGKGRREVMALVIRGGQHSREGECVACGLGDS